MPSSAEGRVSAFNFDILIYGFSRLEAIEKLRETHWQLQDLGNDSI